MEYADEDDRAFFDERKAKEDAIEREFQTLKAARGDLNGFSHRANRFFIRASRVLLGLVLFVVGALCLSGGTNVSDTPFAALTLGMIAGAIFSWGFALLFWYWACLAAFGAAPTHEEIDASLHGEAANNVHRRTSAQRV